MPSLNNSNDVKVTVTSSADTKGISQTQSALGNLSSEAEESTNKTGGLTGAFDSFGKTVGVVGAALAAAKIGEYLKDFVSNGLGAAAELQQTNQGFQTLIGNTTVANRLFGQLVQYANVTPFQSKDITSAARTLLGFGESADQTLDTVKKLGDVAGATGADFSSLALVTGQIFAQGTIHAQDFYQIINSGAGALGPLIAKNLGYNGVGALKNAFEQGKVTSKSFFDALTEATGKGGFAFQGAAKQAQTFNGRLSTLKDAATQAGMALLGVKVDPVLGYQVQPGGVFDRMSKGLIDVTKGLTDAEPYVKTFTTDAGNLFDKVGHFLAPSFEALVNTLDKRVGPSIQRWMPFFKLTAEIVGGILVGALWASVNVLNVMADAMSFLSQVGANVGRDLEGSFKSSFNFIATAWDSTVGKLNFKVPSWVPDLGGKGWNVPDIPHFATGVQNFGGGLAVVGDVLGGSGEVVALPKGSDVYTNQQSRQMMKGGMGGGLQVTQHIYNNVDYNKGIAEIGFRLAMR